MFCGLKERESLHKGLDGTFSENTSGSQRVFIIAIDSTT
jgi:hypothetical protein